MSDTNPAPPYRSPPPDSEDSSSESEEETVKPRRGAPSPFSSAQLQHLEKRATEFIQWLSAAGPKANVTAWKQKAVEEIVADRRFRGKLDFNTHEPAKWREVSNLVLTRSR